MAVVAQLRSAGQVPMKSCQASSFSRGRSPYAHLQTTSIYCLSASAMTLLIAFASNMQGAIAAKGPELSQPGAAQLSVEDLQLTIADPWLQKLLLSLIGILLVSCINLSFRHSTQKLKLPPGPPRWPILGNLPHLGKLPHRDIDKMFNKYGPIIFLKLGSVNVVATNDPEIMKEITMKQDEVFASRPQNMATEYLCFSSNDVAFAPLGPHWKAMRRICIEHLLTTKRLLSFQHQRKDEANCMVREIWEMAEQGQAAIPLRKFLGAFSMNCVTRMLLGKRFFGVKSAGREESTRFKDVVEDSMVLLGVFNIADYFPALRFLDLQGYEKRMKAVREKVMELQTELLDEHHRRKSRQNDIEREADVQNFIDILLGLREEGEERLNDHVIKALVQDMIAAGTDTSSAASEWSMVEIVRNPRVCRKAQEELDVVVGRERLVEEEDLSRLHYIRCIAMESMRVRSVGPFVLPHYSLKETKVAGYDIPTGTQVLMSVYSHARNKKVWGDNADEFYPDRHMGDTTRIENSNGPQMHHIMFGGGRRRCPGAPLGMTLVMLSLARLLQCFDWEPPNGDENSIDVQEVSGLAAGPATPLIALALPRLPRHLKP